MIRTPQRCHVHMTALSNAQLHGVHGRFIKLAIANIKWYFGRQPELPHHTPLRSGPVAVHPKERLPGRSLPVGSRVPFATNPWPAR